MPEPVVSAPLARRQPAVDAVRVWAGGLPGARPLRPEELRAYPNRTAFAGWRLEVCFTDRTRRLDLLLEDGFPRRAPRVALVDRPAFLTWPHVEEDGVLCLLGDSAEVDHSRPAEVAQNLLAEASELIEDLIAGRRQDDFQAEFHSYWNRSVKSHAPDVYSLLEPVLRTRMARVWRGRDFFVVGDEGAIAAWLDNRNPRGGPWKTEPAPVLWLDKPLLPREFPLSPADVMAIARRCGGERLLEQLVKEDAGDVVVVIAADTANGPCMAAVTLLPQAGGRRRPRPGEPIRGFRPGKAPRRLLVSRMFGGGSVVRSTVERADAAWVHGRGQDPRFSRLRASTVAVLGCGSVGAPTALQLARAGVGRLLLIDPELLKWANVGRHPLGAAAVGRSKAEALAERIRTDYPHVLGVAAVFSRWEKADHAALTKLASCDLIVSTIGDWAAEAALNEWHRANRRGPVVYGWTEPHACAGHAVAIIQPGGCLQCGFTAAGAPLLRVTDWPNGRTIRQEPACGATYQPYGAIELGHVVCVVAETAIDCLLGAIARSMSRTWVGRRSLLEAADGRWSAEWLASTGNRPQGGFVEEREWPASPSCVECGPAAA
jgi:sulfur-carrier protein adenylyltransferase/sulfurtransferase